MITTKIVLVVLIVMGLIYSMHKQSLHASTAKYLNSKDYALYRLIHQGEVITIEYRAEMIKESNKHRSYWLVTSCVFAALAACILVF